MHPLPVEPHTLALGESRQVLRDQTVRFGSVRYSTPPGLVGREAFVRVDSDELVIVVDLARLVRRPEWLQGPAGLTEVAHHQLALPGRPVIDPAHYPDHPQEMDGSPRPPRPKSADDAEAAFLALRPGTKSWLIEAAAAGTTRMRVKMAAAVELAALIGVAEVDISLGLAGIHCSGSDGAVAGTWKVSVSRDPELSEPIEGGRDVASPRSATDKAEDPAAAHGDELSGHGEQAEPQTTGLPEPDFAGQDQRHLITSPANRSACPCAHQRRPSL